MTYHPCYAGIQEIYSDGAHCHCHCPPGTSCSRVVIPFASGQAPLIRTNAAGASTTAAIMGPALGSMAATVTLSGDAIDLSERLPSNSGSQCACSLPYDCTVECLYATFGFEPAIEAAPAGGTIIPYIVLYTAPSGSNTFTPLGCTRVNGTPFITAMPPQSMTCGQREGLYVPLSKGTRLMIVGRVEVTGPDTVSKACNFHTYFCGGIGLCIRA